MPNYQIQGRDLGTKTLSVQQIDGIQSITVPDPATDEASSTVLQDDNDKGASELVCTCSHFRLHRPGDLPTCWHVRWVIDNDKDVTFERITGEGSYENDGSGQYVLNAESLQRETVTVRLSNLVNVPLMRHPGVEITVAVQSVDSESTALELWLYNPDEHMTVGEVPFGIIGKGDGRRVIKDTFMDYIDGLAGVFHGPCQAKFHSGPDKYDFSVLWTKPEDPLLADLIDLLVHDRCRDCQSMMVPDEDTRIKKNRYGKLDPNPRRTRNLDMRPKFGVADDEDRPF